MTTLFATMFCSLMTGHAPFCRLTEPPMIYQTQAECRQALESVLQAPMVNGKIVVTASEYGTNWWQCASKQVETWRVEP